MRLLNHAIFDYQYIIILFSIAFKLNVTTELQKELSPFLWAKKHERREVLGQPNIINNLGILNREVTTQGLSWLSAFWDTGIGVEILSLEQRPTRSSR